MSAAGDPLFTASSAFLVSPLAPVVLTGEDLTIEQVGAVARTQSYVELAPEARLRIRVARDVVDRALVRGDAVYGMTTGLGPLARNRLESEQYDEVLIPIVTAHSLAHGTPLPTATVRAMMLTRANGMAKGGAGVRVELVDAILRLLNTGVHPIVRQGGSVGESDLAEMAQIAMVLIGMGEAEYQGKSLPGAVALEAAGLQPVELRPKEALGLISANGLTLGEGSLLLAELEDVLYTFAVSAGLALEGFGGNLSIIHPVAARMKAHPGHRRAAELLRALLQGSYLWQASPPRNLQDPLSFRCIPQIHGACYDATTFVREMLEVELNAAGDNPLVCVEDDSIISVGNFDVLNLAIGFDTLRIALAHVIQIANERVQKQLWSHFSGLPTGLRLSGGSQSGLLPLARNCAALAAEARLLANPVSLTYRAQIAEGIEDHGSMAPLSVRKTGDLLQVAARIAALELVVSARAVDLRGNVTLGRQTRVAYDLVRSRVSVDTPGWEAGIEGLEESVASGSFARVVRGAEASAGASCRPIVVDRVAAEVPDHVAVVAAIQGLASGSALGLAGPV